MSGRTTSSELRRNTTLKGKSLLLSVMFGEKENSTTVGSSTGNGTNSNTNSLRIDRRWARDGLIKRTRVGKTLLTADTTVVIGSRDAVRTAITVSSRPRRAIRTLGAGVARNEGNTGVNQWHKRSNTVIGVFVDLRRGGRNEGFQKRDLASRNVGKSNRHNITGTLRLIWLDTSHGNIAGVKVKTKSDTDRKILEDLCRR